MLFAEEKSVFSKRPPFGECLPPALTPAQLKVANELLDSLGEADVFVLRTAAGMGRTSVLRHIHARTGGRFLTVRHFIDNLAVRRPDAIEQAFAEMFDDAVAAHETIVMDDLHLLSAITNRYHYQRNGLLDAVLEACLTQAAADGRKVIFGFDHGQPPDPVWLRAGSFRMADFTPEDYQAIAEFHLGRNLAPALDFARIHRSAPALNAHQLRRASLHLAQAAEPATADFIEHLTSRNLTGNVEIEEVQPAAWTDLRGMDDVIEALETKIALPFENTALAAELNLKPKRGVLLAGPPGTGKTTIGRALAHRLKGKFFLIDGTAISGTEDFHETVAGVFEAAKKNAPAVIFIDDTDVIFDGVNGGNPGSATGFYRYLLTMMDGLESTSAERVCVMITAMDVGRLPPALLRSGRIELWLETRLPGEAARSAILHDRLSKLPLPLAAADIAVLAAASGSLSGADLKAVVEDGKLCFARDRASGQPQGPVERYFLEAIEEVRNNRRRYARSKPPRLTDDVKFGF